MKVSKKFFEKLLQKNQPYFCPAPSDFCTFCLPKNRKEGTTVLKTCLQKNRIGTSIKFHAQSSFIKQIQSSKLKQNQK